MKAWKKTSPELVAAFDKALPSSPNVTRRPMFGYASAFVNGNMFAGTFQDPIVVRLAVSDRVALLKVKGATPFEPMGRPMKEYVIVPPSIVATPTTLGQWLERGHQYARGLPAKSTSKPSRTSRAGRQADGRKAGDRQEDRDEEETRPLNGRVRTSTGSARIE